jgi:E3 ubiquitin-protein ligase MYCBP2
MCPPGKHVWKHEQCMVCSVCGECTGYGAGCVSANRPDRYGKVSALGSIADLDPDPYVFGPPGS